jgi:hypothetical protein
VLGPATGVSPIARGVAAGAVIGVVAAEHEPISTLRGAQRLASAGSGEPLMAFADDGGIPTRGYVPQPSRRRQLGKTLYGSIDCY